MRENRTYGSVRGGQSNLILSTRLTGLSPRGFLSLTAAMPLRVVEGAYELIEGASLYKTFTTALRARKCIPPLVAGATTFPPQAMGLWVLRHGAMPLQESIERFILSPGWEKVRRSRIRGSRAEANHQNANQAL